MIRKALLDDNKPTRSLLEEKLRTSKKTLSLYLTRLSLKAIPIEALKLTQIQIFDLSFNNLEALPKEIGLFSNIKQLYLNNNPLQYLPIEISLCKSLQVIKLSDSYVKFLPREMAELKKLYDLDLTNCPLEGNLKAAYEKGLCEVFTYLQRKKDRSDYRVTLFC